MENINIETKKQNRMMVYLVILISFLLISVVVATFAYFASTRNVNANIPVGVSTASSSMSFTASSTGTIEFIITAQDMAEANVSTNILKTDNATVKVDLASATDEDQTTCTYDFVWVWDSDDKYTVPTQSLPITSEKKNYPYELSVKVDDANEKDLSTLTWTEEGGVANKSAVIASGLSITAVGTKNVSKTYKIDVNVYNLPVHQEALFNKNFHAHIEIRNNVCTTESIPA